MKTLVYGMLILLAVIVIVTSIIWLTAKFANRIKMYIGESKFLKKPWNSSTPIDLRLFWSVSENFWILQIRKKRRRLLKNRGWRDVMYYSQCGWTYITWTSDTDSLKEEETLRSLIHTYGDLNGYYGLMDDYKQDMKSWSISNWVYHLIKHDKYEETAFTPAARGGLECL